MTERWIWLVALLAGACTGALTASVRRYALARALLDVPNDRSSHSTPTPRGGGLAIVAVVLSGVLLLAALGAIAPRIAIATIGGGALVAYVGWRDDRQHVSAAVRAAVHLVAALWVLGWIGGMPTLVWGDTLLSTGRLGTAVAAIAIVWFINLFNFMDGIDGIAGVEAMSVAGVAGALLVSRGQAGVGAMAWLVAGAAAGFLCWNWPPARIFLGDVGSGFLGLMIAVLALVSEHSGGLPAIVIVVLFGVFIVDATFTLFRRVINGERWYAAHRSHAYQRAVQGGLSHRATTAGVLLINALLAVIAWLGVSRRIGFTPMVTLALAVLLSTYLAVEVARPMSLRRRSDAV